MATAMLEVHLRSGAIVAFDGRVLEVFAECAPSGRFHIAQLRTVGAVEAADGTRTVVVEDGGVTLSFAREEAPACERLLAAIASARPAPCGLDAR
jgi:hypothetical protein